MSDRRAALAGRRQSLLEKSQMQRGTLAQATREIETRLRGVDHVVNMARRVVGHPLLLAGGLAIVMMIGPARLLSLAGRGVVLISAGRRLLRQIR